jgi:hypothetical protein
MGRRIAVRLAAALLTAALAACAPAGGPSSVPSTGPTAPTVTHSPARSAARTITLAQNGQSIGLAVGDRFVLMLGEDFDWTVSPVDESVFAPLAEEPAVAGIQGRYEAIGRGAATISATGDPLCRKVTPPCGAPSMLFEVTIEVR